MKKKLCILALVIAVMFLFVGCGKKNNLTQFDTKKHSIEKKHGITICYGNDKIESKELANAKILSDENKIEAVLEEIDLFFSNLPDGFLEELEGYSNKSICVIVVDEDLSGVSLVKEKKQQWAVDCTMVTSSLAIDMMYSIYWYIEKAENNMKFLADWNKYNPSDFKYGNPDKYKKYLYGNGNDYESYFLMEGNMNSKLDDLRLSFMCLWKEEAVYLQDTEAVPKIHAKFEYLCSELDRVFETVDENAYWARYIK